MPLNTVRIRCWISEDDGALWAFTGPMIVILAVSNCSEI